MANRSLTHFALALAGSALLAAAPTVRAAENPQTTYACQGFDEPLKRNNIHIDRGRVLPLRGKLILPNGKFGDNTVLKTAPVISLKYQPEGKPEVDKTGGLEVRDYGKGTSFVWDAEAHWKFDLGTGNLPDNGQYTVTLLSGDPKEYRVDPVCSLVFQLGP
ncbi:MAG: hypothetical protein ACRD16_09600 [Thermoanaerobaculia bacterium]